MNQIVKEDVSNIIRRCKFWDRFQNKTIFISGASGFLPAYIVETFMFLNQISPNQNTRIIGMVRDIGKARKRFLHLLHDKNLQLIEQDVCTYFDPTERIDFIIHAASQASPKYYGVDPVGTLNANVLGTINLLNLARRKNCESFLYFSSSEVYGSVDENKLPINELTFGYLDPTNRRSCYAESKRMGENLCVSYFHQYQVPAKIARPFHTYGPGMLLDDGRVFADFVSDVVNKRNIVLNSNGSAQRNFCYLADATEGFLRVLLDGKNGEAYNIANAEEEYSIAKLANIVVRLKPEYNLRVLFNDNSQQSEVYVKSSVSRGVPDINKAKGIGWAPSVTVPDGFLRTINSFQQ
jgi:UDP-glucuronate decarboxylase